MRQLIMGVCVMVMFSTSLTAATRTTDNNGAFDDPNTWDCLCVPAVTDDIVIDHRIYTTGAENSKFIHIRSGGELEVNHLYGALAGITVDAGGVLDVRSKLVLKGSYTLNGLHSGNKELFLTNGGVIDGTGTFTSSGQITFQTGGYEIAPSAVLNLSSSVKILLKNTSTISNKGDLTVNFMTGPGTTHFYQTPSSILRVNNLVSSGMSFHANAFNNTVIYNRTVSSQTIARAIDGYYNLFLTSNGLSKFKFINSDIFVFNEFRIENCTFDASYGGSGVYEFSVGGAWNNVSGRFLKRTSEIVFTNNSTISTHLPTAEFHSVLFNGSTQLLDEITVYGDLTVANELDANGFDIHMEGNWDCVGNFIGNNGNVRFTGSQDSEVTGVTDFDNVVIEKSGFDVNANGTMRIYGALHVDNGMLSTNDNVVIASNATRTGRLAEIGFGSIAGDLIVERYLNDTNNGWHLIGSSVEGTTIGDWSDDFITTGFAGADWPTYFFNSITSYDETLPGHKDEGIIGVTSTTDPVPPGEGRRAYIAAGYNLLSVKGPAITGAFSWGLDYTNTGSSTDDGWNLVANPYASTIDWDDAGNWTKLGVRDAIYVWGSEYGHFSSYIAGVGVNGGTQYIPSSQAFWVQANAAGPSLGILEGAKCDDTPDFRNVTPQFFKLRLTAANNGTDEVALRVDENATFDFDSDLDAYSFSTSGGINPSLKLTSTDNIDLSIYSFDRLTEATVIPMPISLPVPGDAVFSVDGLRGFPAGSCRIYDAQEDRYYALRENRDASIYLTEGEYLDRFFLVLGPKSNHDERSFDSVSSDFNIWSDDQNINISTTLDASAVVDVQVYNSLGQAVISLKSVQINGQTSIDALGVRGLIIVELTNPTTGKKYVERLVR